MTAFSYRASSRRPQIPDCNHRHRYRVPRCWASSTQPVNQENAGVASLPEDPVLHDVRMVLVAPKTAANIGAAARAAANFEAPHIWVVAPRCDVKAEEAYKVACSDVLLDRMVVVGTLQEALQDTVGSIGFTRRTGATRLTHASISDMLNQFPSAVPHMTLASNLNSSHNSAGKSITALVFGREESGLTEAELRLCSHACAIPTGRIQGSMNLSHAVTVVLCELYQRRLAVNSWLQADAATRAQAVSGRLSSSHPAAPALASLAWILPASGSAYSLSVQDSVAGEGVQHEGQAVASADGVDEALQPATTSELEALLTKVADIARAVGMSGEESRGGGNQGKHGRRRLPLGHLRALLSRARPVQGEVRSLHGLASKVMAALGITTVVPSSSPLPPGDSTH